MCRAKFRLVCQCELCECQAHCDECQDFCDDDIKRKAILDMADDIRESERYQKEYGGMTNERR